MSDLVSSTLNATAGLGTDELSPSSQQDVIAREKQIRSALPNTLKDWRHPRPIEYQEVIWEELEFVLCRRGLNLWPYRDGSMLQETPAPPSAFGFGYVPSSRPTEVSVRKLGTFMSANPLFRAATTAEGMNVVVRVIAIGEEGAGHLDLLKDVATGMNSLCVENHAVPLLRTVRFEDITFGVFPRIGASVFDAIRGWAGNSVGDVCDIYLQMLEGIAFLHEQGIAHRDAFSDNFLLQWQPGSFASKTISTSRPRVYINDFETAVKFSADCPAEERVCYGVPGSDSINPATNGRRRAPELLVEGPYDPFKLDIWQMSFEFAASQFRTKVPSIDECFDVMNRDDPALRPTAHEALSRLRAVVNAMTPDSLLIEPVVLSY